MALATNTTPGEIQLAGDLGGNNDATAPELSSVGVVPGQYDYSQVTVDAKGRIISISSGDPAGLSALLTPASNSTAGVVQAGIGLDVTQNATAGYQEITFSTSIDGSEATGLSVCAAYTLTISVDFNTQQQLVIPAANTLTINDLIVEINILLTGATAAVVSGKLRITSNTTGTTSLVEINDDGLFGCVNGFVSIGQPILGTASCNMNADIATTGNLGVVQIGSGLLIDGAGVLSVPFATTSSLGSVQIGSGISVDAGGVISTAAIPDATTSTKGLVQIGSGINVAAGVISVSDAENAVKGVVKSANSNNITISAGAVNVGADVALLNVSNNWITSQVVAPSTLTAGVSINTNANLSNVFTLTLTVNGTLENPTNLAAGGRYTFVISQDATGGRLLSYGTTFKFKNGSDNSLSTTASAVDILTCVSNGTDLFCSLAKEFS